MKYLTKAQQAFLDKSHSTPREAAILRAAFQLVNAVSPSSLLDPTTATKALTAACEQATDR